MRSRIFLELCMVRFSKDADVSTAIITVRLAPTNLFPLACLLSQLVTVIHYFHKRASLPLRLPSGLISYTSKAQLRHLVLAMQKEAVFEVNKKGNKKPSLYTGSLSWMKSKYVVPCSFYDVIGNYYF